MVVVCLSDNTFYLKNKNWFSGGLVVFELKHALETTISGSCSVTTNQGIYINTLTGKRKDTYFTLININFISYKRVGGVLVRVLASSAVDRGFEPQSGQTIKNKNKIGMCCFSA